MYWNCSQPTGSTAALMSCTGVQLKVITWWRGLRGCIVRPRWQLIKQVMYTEYVSSWYVANRTTSAYTEFSFRQSILCSLLCSLFWFHIHSYIVPPRGKALSGLLTYVICSSLSWKKHTHLHFFFLRSSPLRPLRQRLICYIYITILISFDFAHLRLSSVDTWLQFEVVMVVFCNCFKGSIPPTGMVILEEESVSSPCLHRVFGDIWTFLFKKGELWELHSGNHKLSTKLNK